MHRLRDRSLITGRGVPQNFRGGGGIQVLPPTKMRGTERVLAMLKGGHRKFEVVLIGDT